MYILVCHLVKRLLIYKHFRKYIIKARSIDNTKMEPVDEDTKNVKISITDINKFKLKKNPHIKIEFDQDSACPKDPSSLVKFGEPGIWEPPNWKDFLVNLQIMRENNEAPVDTMGCHMAMDENAPPEVMRYHSLIALMLSSQTKDQVTFAAMQRLREKGLTVDNVLKMSDDELGKLIYPVGFWKTKVKYIKKTTQTLKNQYNGDIPDSVEKLCKLTGVGPKMAHICMKVAWNKITGIGVDTHVHRISNRIGWVRKPTSTPEDTRKALQFWLPFNLWSEVNHLMVGFGQTICLPINPQCHECLNRDICPSSGKVHKSPKKSPIKKEIKHDNLDSNESNTNEKAKSEKKSPLKRKSTEEEKIYDKISQSNVIKVKKSSTKLQTVKTLQVSKEKASPVMKKSKSNTKLNNANNTSNQGSENSKSSQMQDLSEKMNLTVEKGKSPKSKNTFKPESTLTTRITRSSKK